MKTKIICLTGGVISGLGKGIVLSSLGYLFSKNYKIAPMKLDGYLNVDPGTMNPIEHGEVFVLEDGCECDMDFGNYERFMDIKCNKYQSISMGKIFQKIRKEEREGKYLGQTVQLIPHVTDLIQNEIKNICKKTSCEILFIELGGTIGDIENETYLESLRQLKGEMGKNNMLFIHLSYIFKASGVNEQKTKPTQQSLNLLNKAGIFPEILILRTKENLTEKNIEKISKFGGIEKNCIFSNPNLEDIYKLTNIFYEQKIQKIISKKLNLKKSNFKKNNQKLKKLTEVKKNKKIKILIAGKYNCLKDSYFSVIQNLNLCGKNLKIEIEIIYLNKDFKMNKKDLKSIDGILVPGGFGKNNVENILKIINYSRINKIPFLGICLGLQLSIIEFLKNVCKLKNVNSQEFDKNCENPAIVMIDKSNKIIKYGGTMRLGKYKAILKNGIVKTAYKKNKEFLIENKNFIVNSRHRHRYEVNENYFEILEKNGLKICGKSKNENLCEFIELDKKLHPFFVASQGHIEFNSTIFKLNPLFTEFVSRCL